MCAVRCGVRVSLNRTQLIIGFHFAALSGPAGTEPAPRFGFKLVVTGSVDVAPGEWIGDLAQTAAWLAGQPPSAAFSLSYFA